MASFNAKCFAAYCFESSFCREKKLRQLLGSANKFALTVCVKKTTTIKRKKNLTKNDSFQLHSNTNTSTNGVPSHRDTPYIFLVSL